MPVKQSVSLVVPDPISRFPKGWIHIRLVTRCLRPGRRSDGCRGHGPRRGELLDLDPIEAVALAIQRARRLF